LLTYDCTDPCTLSALAGSAQSGEDRFQITLLRGKGRDGAAPAPLFQEASFQQVGVDAIVMDHRIARIGNVCPSVVLERAHRPWLGASVDSQRVRGDYVGRLAIGCTMCGHDHAPGFGAHAVRPFLCHIVVIRSQASSSQAVGEYVSDGVNPARRPIGRGQASVCKPRLVTSRRTSTKSRYDSSLPCQIQDDPASIDAGCPRTRSTFFAYCNPSSPSSREELSHSCWHIRPGLVSKVGQSFLIRDPANAYQGAILCHLLPT
jgi:hypothetical protein